MTFLDLFRREKKPREQARDRLAVIIARERAATRGGRDYLPQLKQELLAVLAKYENINAESVSVKLDQSGDCDVLELNVLIAPEAPASGGRDKNVSATA